MGSIATLRIRDLEVLSWRDSVDPTFLFLFTTSNVIREPRASDELEDFPEDRATILAATAGELADRLDFLGIGRFATEQAFQQNVEQKLSVTKVPFIPGWTRVPAA